MVFFNRGGEPLTFGSLVKLIVPRNLLDWLGPPGSSKSALMVYVLLQVAAIYGERIYIIKQEGTFKLFGDYCKYFGLRVNQITLHPKEGVSLPPFADAYEMLQR
ncbi:MAG: hypothetical protein K9K86_11850 [Pseudomonadales bacterium]|nr:hypothetical protein [Pseudomonadales bacterium]